MSKQTRYNQILFLMTLSVYMGLVLAGGASPALAQAAMAKGFELKTELEAKDDLDKKPDDKEEEIKQLSSSLEDYFREVENFVKDLKKLHGIDKFDKDFHTFSLSDKSAVPCDVNGDPARRTESTENINDLWIKAAIVNAVDGFEGFDFLSDCVPGKEFGDHKVLKSGLDLSYDKSVLKVKFSATKESPREAKLLLAGLNQAFKFAKPDKEETTRNVLYENTKITSENDQVFIVTNLPRAGLDELLAAQVGK